MGFLDGSICHWRVPGDVALALSYPVLWYRMYSVGVNGVSVETQFLHSLVFILRYVCYPSEIVGISYYNTFAKLWYLGSSIVTLVVLMTRQRASLNFKPTRMLLSSTSVILFISGMAVLTPIIASSLDYSNVQSTVRWGEPLPYNITYDLIRDAPWTMSQLVAVWAMVPQLVMLFKGAGSSGSISLADEDAKPVRIVAGVDVWMWTYVVSVAAFRTFYIPHWIWRYNTQNWLDPISQFCAVLQLSIIYGFVLAIAIKGTRSSNSPLLPETDLGTGKVHLVAQNLDVDIKKPLPPTIIVTDLA